MRILSAFVVLAAAAASAAPCPTRTHWPAPEWPRALEPTATRRAAQLKALEDFAFTLTGKDSDREGYRTNALLVVKGGHIVYERYARGFGPENRHLSWSMAKSVTSALLGVAVKKGALTLTDSICKHLPEYEGRDVCRIRVEDVLTMSSGLAWQEVDENGSYQASSPISAFFGEGHRDMVGHILGHKLVRDPGSRFLYSTGDPQVGATVAKRALERAGLGKDAFWTELFDRIGMGVTFEEDLRGAPLGGSHVFATPRDWAKFGLLYLSDGCWNGERLLPEGWVAASVTPSKGFLGVPKGTEKTANGYSFWVNREIRELELEKPWADAPDDAFAALGHWGQHLVVIPSEDLIIVRTADDRKGAPKVNDLIRHVLEVVRWGGI